MDSISSREAATTNPNPGPQGKKKEFRGEGEVVVKLPGGSHYHHHRQGPDKSLSSPTGFYLRPVKIARTQNHQIEHDRWLARGSRRKYGFRGLKWVEPRRVIFRRNLCILATPCVLALQKWCRYKRYPIAARVPRQIRKK